MRGKEGKRKRAVYDVSHPYSVSRSLLHYNTLGKVRYVQYPPRGNGVILQPIITSYSKRAKTQPAIIIIIIIIFLLFIICLHL
jgi:hypothetical protein